MRPTVRKLTDFEAQIRAMAGKSWRKIVRKEIAKAVKKSAEVIKKNVVKGLLYGRPGWAPLHSYTKRLRRYRGYSGDQPLYQSGLLSKNIEAVVERLDAYIGVVRDLVVTRRSGGAEKTSTIRLADLARMQERGYDVVLTPRMRKFFKHRGLRISRGAMTLRVPARPIMAPAAAESDESVRHIFASAVAQIISTVQISAARASRVHSPGVEFPR